MSQRVLLIACAGRSGSTILDRIIGAQGGFCSLGEVRYIWERSFGENQLCGCGVPFHDCEFWGEVSRGAVGVQPADVDAASAIGLWKRLDNIRGAPWLVQPRSPAAHSTATKMYGQLLERLYATILAVSGERVLVDSSGDATHGLILSRIPSIELDVVHLVRDARAVAFSWTRRRKRPEIHWTSENMPTEHVRRTAARWMMQNTMVERLSRSAASYRRIRYEDFVAEPQAAIAGLLANYEWADGQSGTVTGREVVLEPAHTVSGNPVRFRHGVLRIERDDEWREAMRRGDRRAVTALTWPLLRRYGYHVRDGA
jgi:hypothetical protein